ncbi:TPA: F0F1 ATP synthase subunit A [Streptococcus suis]|uniref:F0F1 ATP synthase subunit A n=1 Tax=Streptococcus suis TaxID=1307 RepID=UPI00155331CC|nr:F0F1 ATP synthase subunit A [Streptococcus suis]MCB2948808.1 F0F1 ATP synthase subunit A [Streptococcus suis]NQL29630.1 F0F1 ATP synthase subunit A [Streptococcus suis]HEL2217986.1 F0F1 ATP synthase subunit A [Streptococcus suis]HEM4151615.1 F0F1 ATP synthase subunit A [Streptococcus suis]
MEEHLSPTLTLGPVTFDLTMVLVSVITISIIFLLVFWASRRMELKPKGKQNVLEYVYELTINFTKGNLGDAEAKRYSLFFFTVFTFLLVANNLGLMTKLETAEGHNLWTSPTANMAYDFGLATIATVFCHVEGIRRRGFKAYLKSFVTPWAMAPMNILEEVTNLVSLALRLYGNIYAGEVLVSLLLQLSQQSALTYPIAFALNVVWTAFSVFISCLQGYVFIMLVSMYLNKKISSESE